MTSFVLYNYFRSSTSFRARVAFHLKNIPFEYKPINLLKDEQHSPDYRKLNPLGGIPTLIHDGKIIPDSMAILEYLEEIHPSPSIMPKDPYHRARVRQVCEIVNASMHPYGNLKVTKYLGETHDYSQQQKDQWVQKWVMQGLDALEKTLPEFAGKYCFGDEVTMADIVLYPQIITCQRFHVDLSKYPTVMKIFDNLDKHPMFIKAHFSRQIDTPEDLRQP
ncbi:maleylacetoacetate isomerase [Bdellovibrio sp. ZAP7]|uniref:maleylacetoacetate isomerase n=1 Tax=Bdellovibrio sp. ZAP7 TaxID=2231053 RepID=UPI00115BC672|nr:maleylacetoacetate isomerase [Bdellovibrio sp. ZAP7]QDK43904.1 maleylacetoacetate isomerase [Bdellovibrio sp. ZAP7]